VSGTSSFIDYTGRGVLKRPASVCNELSVFLQRFGRMAGEAEHIAHSSSVPQALPHPADLVLVIGERPFGVAFAAGLNAGADLST
jgi:hypothetical protein